MKSKSRSNTLISAFLTILMIWWMFAQAQGFAPAQSRKPKSATSAPLAMIATRELTEDQAVIHALNRLGFGPRPGDVERVRQMGLQKFIEQQLNPAGIPDAAVEAKLERYTTLNLSASQLLQDYPQPNKAAKKLGMTPEEYRREMEQKIKKGDGPMVMEAGMKNPQRIVGELSLAKLTRAVYSERQLQEEMVDFWFNHFNVFAVKGADRWLLTSYERDVIRPRAMGKFRDLLGATASSPAMLFYLDNWQSADPQAAERMGNELAERRNRMLSMLGNPRVQERIRQRGMDPSTMQGPEAATQPERSSLAAAKRMERMKKRPRGLNENYARELMELHTLGVDGGYTQQDIIEVARAFTGWTMRAPRQSAEFYFDDRIHAQGPKTVLGRRINAGGMKDGEEILDLLSRHPNTARFISTKLARRFVADEPPPALVDRMAKTFLDTDGDIRAVLHTMIYSPEFWSKEIYRAKIKRPFELVASALRATGADLDQPLPLLQWTERIGEPLYRCQPPTGYSDKAETWVNTGALLNRMNFALALASNKMRGVRVDAATVLAMPAGMTGDPLSQAIQVFLAGQISQESRATLEKQLAEQKASPDVVAGLVLGSPEFQRR